MKNKFKERLTKPGVDNPYYIKTTHGGFNKAIAIDRKTGYVLPNCCGLVHGRWLECAGITDPGLDKLCRGNASSYWNFNDGYERGQEPRLGAVACFSRHVATVERISERGAITLSNSSYGGEVFYLTETRPPYKFKDQSFYGFIYNPLLTAPDDKDKYEKGAKVKIIGPGNSRADGGGHSATSRHYIRYILKVHDGAEYPYQVGSKGGATTGFYKADALEIL